MKANTIKSISKTNKKLIKLVSALDKCDEKEEYNSSMPTAKGTFDLHGNECAMLDTVKVKNALQRKSNAGGLKTTNKCKMHQCGSHVCHPEEMGESDYVQTVEINKQQVSEAV
jgi:hypothetical protein